MRCRTPLSQLRVRQRVRVHQRITGPALAVIEVAGDRVAGELRVVEPNVDRIGGDARTDNAARRRWRKQQQLLVQRDGHGRTRVEHRVRRGLAGERQRLPADQRAGDGERIIAPFASGPHTVNNA